MPKVKTNLLNEYEFSTGNIKHLPSSSVCLITFVFYLFPPTHKILLPRLPVSSFSTSLILVGFAACSFIAV